MPPEHKRAFSAWCKLCRASHAEGKHRPAVRDREALAAATAKGRAEGFCDALLLIGVSVGLGIAKALAPLAPERCSKRSITLGQCRLEPGHEGDCDPRRWR